MTHSIDTALRHNGGGYDDEYKRTTLLWGSEPAELLKHAIGSIDANRMLDLGCGDGKNAYFAATKGVNVEAVDLSEFAIRNAVRAWPTLSHLTWRVADVSDWTPSHDQYDLIVATGLLHCLRGQAEVEKVVGYAKNLTPRGGMHLISAINDRDNDWSGHSASFRPCLLSHETYRRLYDDWIIVHCSDQTQSDRHPHLGIQHHHSISRILALRP